MQHRFAHGLPAVGGDRDDLEPLEGGQDADQAGADDRVVVGDEHADHASAIGRHTRTSPPCGPGADLAAAAQLGDPLAHPGDPDARTPGGRAAAVVEHLAVQPASSAAEPHDDRGRTGVPDDVGERLGGDPVDRLLDGGRQRRQLSPPRPRSAAQRRRTAG